MRNLQYAIGFWADMFMIPALSGEKTFTQADKIIPFFEDAYNEETLERKWCTYKLYENYNVRKWFEILRLNLQHVALTQEQAIHFLTTQDGMLLPRKYVYLIMKGKDEFYLAEVTTESCFDEKEYHLNRYEIDDIRPLHPMDKDYATLVFLFHPEYQLKT
jgi:hypothetical protein